MSYTDKILTCSDCGVAFTFGAGEQEFFASKGFTNEPRRCPDCRAARKQQRSGGYGGGYRQRQMYPATCASCGKDCQVPFEPRDERPVYCSDCYTPGRQ
ncbi:MAG: zinc-ribbon domain containing protein [Dehalococcoidia bacterium]|nr:MAG: zinc-ribbon domain containing protein [Dehalococcoidia bacterium]